MIPSSSRLGRREAASREQEEGLRPGGDAMCMYTCMYVYIYIYIHMYCVASSSSR